MLKKKAVVSGATYVHFHFHSFRALPPSLLLSSQSKPRLKRPTRASKRSTTRRHITLLLRAEVGVDHEPRSLNCILTSCSRRDGRRRRCFLFVTKGCWARPFPWESGGSSGIVLPCGPAYQCTYSKSDHRLGTGLKIWFAFSCARPGIDSLPPLQRALRDHKKVITLITRDGLDHSRVRSTAFTWLFPTNFLRAKLFRSLFAHPLK